MQRSPLAGERMLATWGDFSLSTHRVWALHGASAKGMLSAPVDTVDAVGIESQHFPVLLLLAGIAALLGLSAFASSNPDSSTVGVLSLSAAIAMGLAYFGTRKVAVAVHSGGVRLTSTLSGGGASLDEAMRFLNLVEEQALRARGNLGRA